MVKSERAELLTILDGILACAEVTLQIAGDYQKKLLTERIKYVDPHGYVHWKEKTEGDMGYRVGDLHESSKRDRVSALLYGLATVKRYAKKNHVTMNVPVALIAELDDLLPQVTGYPADDGADESPDRG